MLHTFISTLLYLFTFSILSTQAFAKESPKIQLATVYKSSSQQPISINEYWVSEKLDGIRGYWNGTNLFTRNGNLIHAPSWFTINWPNKPIDGELWSGRGEFEIISSCVRRKAQAPEKELSCWQKIRFMIFDLPKNSGTFKQRIEQMRQLTLRVNSPYLSVIKQDKTTSIAILHQRLSNIVNSGGEGLMLHHQDAYYKTGRNSDLMKLKQYNDAEAIVITHIAGKGKYKYQLGSLEVKMPSGLTFKVGTGFTDKQRQSPPPIGSIITYKYIGKTARGVPRFASFLRIREPLLIQ